MERSLHSYRNSSLKRVFLALDFDMLSKDYIIGLVSYGQKEQQKKQIKTLDLKILLYCLQIG